MYEQSFEELIKEALKKMYGKSHEDTVIRIFFLRAKIYYDKNKITTEEYTDFLIKELNLPDTNYILYNNGKIAKRYFTDNDCIEAIIDDWHFRYLEKFEFNLKGEKVEVYKILLDIYAKYKVLADTKFKYVKKRSDYYNERYKYFMLLQLYKDFDLQINHPGRIQGIIYDTEHIDFSLTIDEYFQRFSLLYDHLDDSISEEELEDYIVKNPQLLEGLKIINRQYTVKSGVIDLLCEDKEGNKVVVELKVKERPKDLIWQLKSYSKDIQQMYKEDNVSVMAITPELDDSILRELKEMNAAVYYFQKKKNGITLKKHI